MGVCSCSRGLPFLSSSPSSTTARGIKRSSKPTHAARASSNLIIMIRSMATQKPTTKTTVPSKKVSGSKPAPPKSSSKTTSGQSIKLLTRVEQLRLLTKAEKAGLLSQAEKAGLTLSSIEKLGLLSKAEELGVLSAATNPGTPTALLNLSICLLVLGPLCAYLVPEQYSWEVVLQVVVALVCVLGGSAAFAASSFVSTLQKST